MTKTIQREVRHRYSPYILISKMWTKSEYKLSRNHIIFSLFIFMFPDRGREVKEKNSELKCSEHFQN